MDALSAPEDWGLGASSRQRMVEVYGPADAAWLDRLPTIIADCERRWSIRVKPPFTPLSYNYVAPAVRADGSAAVLKVGFPNRELWTEMEALRLFDGRGMVQLFGSDRELGAMLLERLEPGTPLSHLADDVEATTIAAQVMRRLRRPVPAAHSFPSVADWAAGLQRLRTRFGGTTGRFPEDLVAEAEALFAELIPSMAEPVLLHGDLHHENILTAERQPWLALDPKGVIGEPAYEVGALLRNPMPGILSTPQPKRTMARRLDQLSEGLGFDRQRLRDWALAQAVLAAWWAFEDHGHYHEPWIACSELFAAL